MPENTVSGHFVNLPLRQSTKQSNKVEGAK